MPTDRVAYPVPALPWDATWLAALRSAADQPPLRPRVPFFLGHECVGSVEPDFFAAFVAGSAALDTALVQRYRDGWSLAGGSDAHTASAQLARLAHALRTAPGSPVARLWRDEGLAVWGANGHVLAQLERGAARALGIATRAVHLLGLTPNGDSWIQQRALDKPTDPGRWDTLMGGMVPATDTLEQALARETWEEAGLHISELTNLRHAGNLLLRKPASADDAIGYVVERADAYVCTVPAGCTPENQDGEVAQFACVAPAQLQTLLEADQFTVEAALLLAHFQPA